MLKKIIVICLPFLLTGCAAIVITSDNNTNQYRVSTKTGIPSFFEAERTPAPIVCVRVNHHNEYQGCEFSFDSWRKSKFKKNNTIEGELYLPIAPKSKEEWFLIIPGSGENVSSSFIAKTLAEAGFYTLRIYSGFKPLTDKTVQEALKLASAESAIEHLGNISRQSIKQRIVDLMRIADFMETVYGIKKINTIGISLGGGVGSLFATVDPRNNGLMMALSSANMAKILIDAASNRNPPTSLLRGIKHLVYEKFGLTRDQAYELFNKELEIVEPITYKERLDKNKILIVSGALDIFGIGDSIIPYSATSETWKAFGKPEWVILATGHFTSGLALLPFWLELPHIHHFFYTTYQSYLSHLVKEHFLPKVLN